MKDGVDIQVDRHQPTGKAPQGCRRHRRPAKHHCGDPTGWPAGPRIRACQGKSSSYLHPVPLHADTRARKNDGGVRMPGCAGTAHLSDSSPRQPSPPAATVIRWEDIARLTAAGINKQFREASVRYRDHVLAGDGMARAGEERAVAVDRILMPAPCGLPREVALRAKRESESSCPQALR